MRIKKRPVEERPATPPRGQYPPWGTYQFRWFRLEDDYIRDMVLFEKLVKEEIQKQDRRLSK